MSIIKKLKAIRGAICCEDNNESIQQSVVQLYTDIIKKNQITEKDIISIHFTITKDITSFNPASALRKAGFASALPLFCALEPNIQGSLAKTIRILLYCYSRKKIYHLYLNGAEILRPDLQ